MQLTKKQLQRQQIVMAHLGFYKHKCDGIWGPESIQAKRKFESHSSFIPALPTNGLPFGEKEKYPKGMRMGADHLFTYTDPNGKVENNLTEQKIKQLAGNFLFDDIKPKVAVVDTTAIIPKEENAPLVTSTAIIQQKEEPAEPVQESEKTEIAVVDTNKQTNDTHNQNYNKHNNGGGYKGRR